MTGFRKYMHLEHYGHAHVDGLLTGEVIIQPKLDGTNGCIWYDEVRGIQFGSRNRDLRQSDNQGFVSHLSNDRATMECLQLYFDLHPNRILYGEWLVPHTFKDYKETAWRKFYIFDVLDRTTGSYLDIRSCEDGLVIAFSTAPLIGVVPTLAMVNPTLQKLIATANTCDYLCKDDVKCGEGIVVKRFNHISRIAHEQVHMKIIAQTYRNARIEEGYCVKSESTEEALVKKYATSHFLQKEYAKELAIGLNISRFIGNSYFVFVQENVWDMIKKSKTGVIDFKHLNKHYIIRLKAEFPEIFKK